MSDEIRVCTSCWEEDCVCDYERYIELDENISDIIITLNLKGYRTLYSCEGHIKDDDGTDNCEGVLDIYIKFDQRYDFVLPEGFSWSRNKKNTDMHHTILYKYKHYKYKGTKLLARIDNKYISFDLYNDKLKYLDLLRQWADNLEPLDKNLYRSHYSQYLLTGETKVPYYHYELKNQKTFIKDIKNNEFDEISIYIEGYGGKIEDIIEQDDKIKITYRAKEDLFNMNK